MSPAPSPSQTVFRIGLAVFAVGVLATVATLIPLFTGADPLPVAFYLLSMLAPLGFAIVLVGLWRNGRRRRLREPDDAA